MLSVGSEAASGRCHTAGGGTEGSARATPAAANPAAAAVVATRWWRHRLSSNRRDHISWALRAATALVRGRRTTRPAVASFALPSRAAARDLVSDTAVWPMADVVARG
eukprot:1693416-Prymnesium_polylepis.2